MINPKILRLFVRSTMFARHDKRFLWLQQRFPEEFKEIQRLLREDYRDKEFELIKPVTDAILASKRRIKDDKDT